PPRRQRQRRRSGLAPPIAPRGAARRDPREPSPAWGTVGRPDRGGPMATPERITIDIPQSELDDLRARLHNTRWPVDPGKPDERYGADRAWTEDLGRYSADTFHLRAVAGDMNGYEQYRVAIDGIPIHYMRVPGKGPKPMPI